MNSRRPPLRATERDREEMVPRRFIVLAGLLRPSSPPKVTLWYLGRETFVSRLAPAPASDRRASRAITILSGVHRLSRVRLASNLGLPAGYQSLANRASRRRLSSGSTVRSPSSKASVASSRAYRYLSNRRRPRSNPARVSRSTSLRDRSRRAASERSASALRTSAPPPFGHRPALTGSGSNAVPGRTSNAGGGIFADLRAPSTGGNPRVSSLTDTIAPWTSTAPAPRVTVRPRFAACANSGISDPGGITSRSASIASGACRNRSRGGDPGTDPDPNPDAGSDRPFAGKLGGSGGI